MTIWLRIFCFIYVYLGDELRQKCETERNEIERLHQEIAELQAIRDDLYEEDDSSASSSEEEEDEEQLQQILNNLIRENEQLVVSQIVIHVLGSLETRKLL